MRISFLLSVLFFFARCGNSDNIPGDIIPKDSMAVILWDIIQADQFSNQYMIRDSARINVKAETMGLYQEIFRIHHTTKEEFQKSYQYYLAHPDITKLMFDSLSAQANRRRGEAFRSLPKNKITPDTAVTKPNHQRIDSLNKASKINVR